MKYCDKKHIGINSRLYNVEAYERGGNMKRILLILLTTVIVISLACGCTLQENKPEGEDETNEPGQTVSTQERQRMDLYIAVMKTAFLEENGGDAFIAVKLDTLDGLSGEAKQEVLKGLGSLSPNVYSYDDVKDDNTKFETDDEGRKIRTLDGALLWVEVDEYSESKAKITGVSWFGNLGAVFPHYEAVYKNGIWQLKLIRMAVS